MVRGKDKCCMYKFVSVVVVEGDKHTLFQVEFTSKNIN